MAVSMQRRVFSVDEYHRLPQAGVLREQERLELINGEILTMTPIGSYHASRVNRLTRVFTRIFGDRVIVQVQNPVKIDNYSEPEPDLALLKPQADFYAARLPEPPDVLLIVEVADTSLAYDRDVKLPLYAKQGIPEAWLVNLPNNCVEVFAEPSPQGYELHRIFRKGMVTSPTLPDLQVALTEILG
jgi:Uma2 family endonuclease